jgi:hypothetical protein
VGERAVNPEGSAPRNEGLDSRRTTAHPTAPARRAATSWVGVGGTG